MLQPEQEDEEGQLLQEPFPFLAFLKFLYIITAVNDIIIAVIISSIIKYTSLEY